MNNNFEIGLENAAHVMDDDDESDSDSLPVVDTSSSDSASSVTEETDSDINGTNGKKGMQEKQAIATSSASTVNSSGAGLDRLPPLCPFSVCGGIVVTCLGTIEFKRPRFHKIDSIYPIGYKSVRLFKSPLDLHNRVPFTSEIRDGGDAPLFVVTALCNPPMSWQGKTASAVWIQAAKVVNDLTKSRVGVVTVSGPNMYGLSHPDVIEAIRRLPNADKCLNYAPTKAKAPGLTTLSQMCEYGEINGIHSLWSFYVEKHKGDVDAADADYAAEFGNERLKVAKQVESAKDTKKHEHAQKEKERIDKEKMERDAGISKQERERLRLAEKNAKIEARESEKRTKEVQRLALKRQMAEAKIEEKKRKEETKKMLMEQKREQEEKAKQAKEEARAAKLRALDEEKKRKDEEKAKRMLERAAERQRKEEHRERLRLQRLCGDRIDDITAIEQAESQLSKQDKDEAVDGDLLELEAKRQRKMDNDNNKAMLSRLQLDQYSVARLHEKPGTWTDCRVPEDCAGWLIEILSFVHLCDNILSPIFGKYSSFGYIPLKLSYNQLVDAFVSMDKFDAVISNLVVAAVKLIFEDGVQDKKSTITGNSKTNTEDMHSVVYLVNGFTWPELTRQYLMYTMTTSDGFTTVYEALLMLGTTDYSSLPLSCRIALVHQVMHLTLDCSSIHQMIEAKVQQAGQLRTEWKRECSQQLAALKAKKKWEKSQDDGGGEGESIVVPVVKVPNIGDETESDSGDENNKDRGDADDDDDKDSDRPVGNGKEDDDMHVDDEEEHRNDDDDDPESEGHTYHADNEEEEEEEEEEEDDEDDVDIDDEGGNGDDDHDTEMTDVSDDNQKSPGMQQEKGSTVVTATHLRLESEDMNSNNHNSSNNNNNNKHDCDTSLEISRMDCSMEGIERSGNNDNVDGGGHMNKSLGEADIRQLEQAIRKQLEEKYSSMLKNLTVVQQPIGVDRNMCRYWVISDDYSHLWVETPDREDPLGQPPLRYASREHKDNESTADDTDSEDEEVPLDPWSARQGASKPSVMRFYCNLKQISALIDWLDPTQRGIREHSLKDKLFKLWGNFQQVMAPDENTAESSSLASASLSSPSQDSSIEQLRWRLCRLGETLPRDSFHDWVASWTSHAEWLRCWSTKVSQANSVSQLSALLKELWGNIKSDILTPWFNHLNDLDSEDRPIGYRCSLVGQAVTTHQLAFQIACFEQAIMKK